MACSGCSRPSAALISHASNAGLQVLVLWRSICTAFESWISRQLYGHAPVGLSTMSQAFATGSPLILGVKEVPLRPRSSMPRSPGGLRDPAQPLECYLASDASAVVEHTKSYAPCQSCHDQCPSIGRLAATGLAGQIHSCALWASHICTMHSAAYVRNKQQARAPCSLPMLVDVTGVCVQCGGP